MIKKILNELSELVYIADVETYDVLYINSRGKENFCAGESYEGRKCYEVFHNRSFPCEFCTNRFLTFNEFFTWEHANEVSGRRYLLKDRLVMWEGKKARMELAFEVADKDREQVMFKNILDMDTALVNCLKELQSNETLDVSLNKLLMYMGTLFQAERAYVFEIRGDKIYNTHEWCSPSTQSTMENLQALPLSVIARWSEAFDRGDSVIIEDTEDIKSLSPYEYEILKMQGIRQLVAAPYFINKQLAGFIGVDDPEEEKLVRSNTFFATLGFFISAAFVKAQTEERLRQFAYIDLLTGLQNRNRFMKELDGHWEFERVGVAYIDLNGLKEINDEDGHQAGDEILSDVSAYLKQCFGFDSSYRLGGDEFVIMDFMSDEDTFAGKVANFKKFLKTKRYTVAMGVHFVNATEDLNAVLKIADELMYADKKAHYRRHIIGRYRSNSDLFSDLLKEKSLLKKIKEGKFEIFFQPIFDIKTNELFAAEALIRYREDDRKLILPELIIPLLEEKKLIHHIDYFMFDAVCGQLQEWKNQGRKSLRATVNLSSSTLLEEDFINKIRKIFYKYSLEKNEILLEVTENHCIYGETADLVKAVNKLRNEDFCVILDDFDCKSVGLELFSDVEWSAIKCECTLFTEQPNAIKREVFTSILKICRDNQIKTVVDFVETDTQLEQVKTLEFDYVQGFRMQRPLPKDCFKERFLPILKG